MNGQSRIYRKGIKFIKPKKKLSAAEKKRIAELKERVESDNRARLEQRLPRGAEIRAYCR